MTPTEAIIDRLKDYLKPVDIESLKMYGGVVGDLSSVLALADIVRSYHSTEADEERVTALLRAWIKLHFAEVELPALPNATSQLDKLLQWEKMSLSQLLMVLTKWFNCDSFDLNVISRPSVVTRVWFTLRFELPEWKGYNKIRFVSASSLGLLQERLIACLDREKLSPNRIENKVLATLDVDQRKLFDLIRKGIDDATSNFSLETWGTFYNENMRKLPLTAVELLHTHLKDKKSQLNSK